MYLQVSWGLFPRWRSVKELLDARVGWWGGDREGVQVRSSGVCGPRLPLLPGERLAVAHKVAL